MATAKFVLFVDEATQRRFDGSKSNVQWVNLNVGCKRVHTVNGEVRVSIYRHGVLEREYVKKA